MLIMTLKEHAKVVEIIVYHAILTTAARYVTLRTNSKDGSMQ